MERKQWWNLKLPVILTIGFTFLFSAVIAQKESVTGNLQVEISGVRNNKGVLLLSLYNQSIGFPENSDKAFSKRVLKATAGKISTEWTSLVTGNYAIAVLHDENKDAKMNTNLFGIPLEGFGFSNNKIGLAGPPSFQRASVDVKMGVNRIVINLRY